MGTSRKLALTSFGLALVAIIGVVGGLAFSASSSSSKDTSQFSPPAQRGRAGDSIEPDPDFQDALRRSGISRRGWQTDFSRHSVPYSEILSGRYPS